MGYFSGSPTLKGLIADLIKPYEGSGQTVAFRRRTIAHCWRGNNRRGVLWIVSEATRDDGVTRRWISLADCDYANRRDDRSWGYKPMDEADGPYRYSCPLGYLKLVPDGIEGTNAEWRAAVRAYHARKAEERQARRPAKA